MSTIDFLFLQTRLQLLEALLLKTKKDKELYIVYLEKFKDSLKENAPAGSDALALIEKVSALQKVVQERLQR